MGRTPNSPASLEQLLVQLNPYLPAQPVSGVTGANAPARLMRFAHGDISPAQGLSFSHFNFETQDDPAYRLDWTWLFKGQARIIRRALRFQYSYPVQGGDGAMATDYLLIGYEGGGGP
jgi:hypothetical protein